MDVMGELRGAAGPAPAGDHDGGGVMDNAYAVLGVDWTPDDQPDMDVLRSAYRRAALAAHPDRGGSDDDMRAVSEAWAVLSDPERRAELDAWLHAAVAEGTFAALVNTEVESWVTTGSTAVASSTISTTVCRGSRHRTATLARVLVTGLILASGRTLMQSTSCRRCRIRTKSTTWAGNAFS